MNSGHRQDQSNRDRALVALAPYLTSQQLATLRIEDISEFEGDRMTLTLRRMAPAAVTQLVVGEPTSHIVAVYRASLGRHTTGKLFGLAPSTIRDILREKAA